MNAIPLKPCPFCGGDAESDTRQHFIDYQGNPANAVAVYCTKCSADMTMCHGDYPEYTPEEMLTMLTEAWNIRAQPNLDLRPERQ